MLQNIIFTIGHSTHSIEQFLALVKLHRIEVVADVRSSPVSRRNPQFNRENLQNSLNEARLRYVFLGKELGARSDNPDCYVNDRVQYDRLAKTELFQSGMERILEGQKSFRIALMCAEKEPLNCHRTILIARELDKKGCRIAHILSDGSLEYHNDTISRLKSELGLSKDDMFLGEQQLDDLAYITRAEKIAYKRSE